MLQRVFILGGLGLGAVAALVLDPSADTRRRRLRQFGERVQRLFHRQPPTDAQIASSVRAAVQRAVSDPSAIQVAVVSGNVTLCGRVLVEEEAALVRATLEVTGVRSLDAHLDTTHLPAASGWA